MTPEQAQKLSKMERMEMVVAYAKSVGFTKTEMLFWPKDDSSNCVFDALDEVMPGNSVTYDVGLMFESDLTVAIRHGDERSTVFDTEEEAEAFLRQQGGAA